MPITAHRQRSKPTKREKRLEGRVIAFQQTMNDKTRRGAPKVDQRVETGGYHKPGSMNK